MLTCDDKTFRKNLVSNITGHYPSVTDGGRGQALSPASYADSELGRFAELRVSLPSETKRDGNHQAESSVRTVMAEPKLAGGKVIGTDRLVESESSDLAESRRIR